MPAPTSKPSRPSQTSPFSPTAKSSKPSRLSRTSRPSHAAALSPALPSPLLPSSPPSPPSPPAFSSPPSPPPSPLSLTFFGGASEIGGNKILLQTPRSKIYLDFGESFDFGEDYFYEWLVPRAANGLECYFEFGIVPKIPKLYSRAQLQFTDLPYERSDIDGVFLSHHHSDHVGHLSFLDEEIPLYMGHGTKGILDAYSSLFPSSEEEVYENVKGIIKRSKGLVLSEFSMCNIDRFHSIFKAAQDAGRTFVVDTKYAFLLDRFRDLMELPDPRTDKSLKVYYKLSKNREFSPKDYRPYEQEYMGNMITFREILANQRRYVMFTGFNKLMELIYIRPENADYVYSSSESFLEGEENKEQRRVLDNWLKHFGITLHKAHCSGHAGKSDLKYAVRKINPEILIPIHTQNPEEFQKIHDHVIIPKRGETIDL